LDNAGFNKIFELGGGLSQGCLEKALGYAKVRSVFGVEKTKLS
jgi:hypothetical protein